MKYTILCRAAALLLSLTLALSLAACGGSGQPDSGKTPNTDAVSGGDTGTADDWQGYSDEAQAAIDELFARREQEFFAAAILGYREEGDTTDLAAWLHNEAPTLAAFWPFLPEIPQEDIVGDHGYLYCIVPLDNSISFTVKSVEWEYLGNGTMPHYSEPLYCGEVGRPFLLYSTCESWVDDADVVVETVEADGFVGTWSPGLEPDGGLTNPLTGDGGYVVLDFARLYDVGDCIPRLDDGYAPDAEWLPPTELGLANTSWYSDNGWLLAFGADGSAEDGKMLYPA